jgi:hypothetical protein
MEDPIKIVDKYPDTHDLPAELKRLEQKKSWRRSDTNSGLTEATLIEPDSESTKKIYPLWIWPS